MKTVRNDSLENRKITIADIAEALQVSKTTVSRAISGKGRISEDTRQKVLAYIEEAEYKPNVIAKGLAQKKTYNIAFVIPGDCNLADMPFIQNSMQGICEEASASDYDVMLVVASGNAYGNLARIVANNKVDGVILSRAMIKDKAVAFLRKQNIPFVLMGTTRETEVLQVDNDHRTGCCVLTERLLYSGSTRIGLVGGSKSYVVNHTRIQGYRDAYRKAGITLDESLIYEDCTDTDKVEMAVYNLLDAKVACLICMDDAICLTVLQILARKKVTVPEQIQVASFYDSALLQAHRPAVTSLLFDDKALGALTCNVLLRYMGGEEVRTRTLLGYEFVNRDSTLLGCID